MEGIGRPASSGFVQVREHPTDRLMMLGCYVDEESPPSTLVLGVVADSCPGDGLIEAVDGMGRLLPVSSRIRAGDERLAQIPGFFDGVHCLVTPPDRPCLAPAAVTP